MHGVQPMATSAPRPSARAERAVGSQSRVDADAHPIEHRAEHAGHRQAEADDDDAGRLPRLRDPEQRGADEAERGPEHDEEGAEAGDEQQRLGQDGGPGAGRGHRAALRRRAAEEGEIDRQQREHARGEEAQGPGGDRDRDADVGHRIGSATIGWAMIQRLRIV